MAEHEEKNNPMEVLVLVVGGMALLIFLWFASGAYKNADIRGLFIAPPAPLGPGGSYGPQVGNPNPNYTDSNEQTQ